MRGERSAHAIAPRFLGDDVDDTAHGVGAIEHRGGSPQHFHVVHVFSGVEIGYVVGIDTGELRLAVHHHQHGVGRFSSYTSHLDAPGTSVADAEAEDIALGNEEAGYLRGDGGKQLGLPRGF